MTKQNLFSIHISAGGSGHIRLTAKECDTVPLYISLLDENGRSIDTENVIFTARALTPETADLTDGLNILPKSEGNARFRITAEYDGQKTVKEATLPVCRAKRKATYMTAEKCRAARDNIQKYEWADTLAAKVIRRAQLYSENTDRLYDLICSQGVPRASSIGETGDPFSYVCRWCNTDLRAHYGARSWVTDSLHTPFKLQCPACRRKFPSNDFEGFYRLGLNEYGEFDRLRALEKHRAHYGDKSIADPGAEHSARWKAYYGYGNPKGFLFNQQFPELFESVPDTVNTAQGLREGESAATWGVDDGFGYIPTRPDGTPHTYPNGVRERHNYVAVFMHFGVFKRTPGNEDDQAGAVADAVSMCADAYSYTGDEKFGRTAAVLLDRVADFYPDYTLAPFGRTMKNPHGGTCEGKLEGCIWDTGSVYFMMTAYDQVFELYEKDPRILEYIRTKGKSLRFRHAKETPSQICTNIEDGIFRTMFSCLQSGMISGNFGYPQKPNALGAVVLDSMPETQEWLDYLMAPGWTRMAGKCPGGGIGEILTNTVDADGMGDEASGYNIAWCSTLMDIQSILDAHEAKLLDLWREPKFMQMVYAMIPLVSGTYSPQIGDTASTAALTHWFTRDMLKQAYLHTKDYRFAQLLYLSSGNKADGLHYDITVPDAGRLAEEVQAVIDTYGTFTPQSELMTGFGFAALRDGCEFDPASAAPPDDTRRNAWMYFGSNSGHGHKDTLNLGMTAWGVNIMPDLGYPEETGTQPNRLQWASSTISHNTVMVNGHAQTPEGERRGNLLHFDDAGTVKVMDADAAYVYPETTAYHRTVLMIRADADNSYYVDFFRVRGGEEHIYSLHTIADTVREYSGLDFVPQCGTDGAYVGSYAGPDVPWGPDPNSPPEWYYETRYPRGFTWLKNVDHADHPDDIAEMDFALRDCREAMRDSRGIGMHMTLLSRGNRENGMQISVAAADGLPPQKASNKVIGSLRYVLVRHWAEAADSVFTVLFEPYRFSRFLRGAEELTAVPDTADAGDKAARVLKITHACGRIDYVFYAEDNSVTYSVRDGERCLRFRGFVGVYSVDAGGKVILRYVCDGDIIGTAAEGPARITATVTDFSRTITDNNFITVKPDCEFDTEQLRGRVIIIENAPTDRRAAYRIESAEKLGTEWKLHIGRVTTVRRYADSAAPDKGYIHTITEGMKAYIPLSYSEFS